METSNACAACGAKSPLSARFCAQCGARLPQAAGAGARFPVERRQITVMFCDLVGSTRLSVDLDAEDFTVAVSAYRDACVRVVRRWGGHISRYVGDGVLVYFGYPRAREDDALRGVAAAWELARTVEQLALPAGGSTDTPAPLRVRIGLHTGLVVVGELIGRESLENDGALGAAPNIAARMQALCEPGEVVVSEDTVALLPPAIVVQALQRPVQRNDYGPVRPLRVVAVPQALMHRRTLSASRLFGRSDTLERLLQLLRGPAHGVRCVFLQADAGLGKSRLLQELIAHPRAEPLRWVRVSCSPYGQHSPLHPFQALAGAGAVSTDADADGTPYELRRLQFVALRAALLAGDDVLGLVVEDLHWADSTTVEFVADLLRDAPAGPMVLLMTSREPPPAELAAASALHVETISRLSPGDAAALARAIETLRPLTAFEVAEIVDHADGVPLFIEEFVRARAAREAGADGIPITLRDSLMSVLDTLGTGRTVALCASVFGRRFEYGQLQALLALPQAELVPALRALTDAQVLVQAGEIPNAWFEFRHALLRDTAYHTLLRSERTRWHRRVAELAAAGTLPVEDSMPELLATHHSLGENRRSAIGYWLKAQERAMRRSAHVEALAHLRSGLADCGQLARHEPAEAERLELELLRRMASPLIAISGWSTPDLERVYERAMRLCRGPESDDARFELERGLYNMHLLRSELRTADAIADRLLATARAAGDAAHQETLLLVALRSKALPAFYGGDFDEARRWLEAVLDLYDPARHAGHALRYGTDPGALALSFLAWMDAAQGAAERAAVRAEAALQHACAERHMFSQCYALCFAASAAQLNGDAPTAHGYAAQAAQLANRHNFPYWIAWARAVDAWVTGQRSPDVGLAQIAAARESYLATGSTLVEPYFEALACSLALATGNPDAPARQARLQETAARTGVRFWESVLLPAQL